MGCGNSTINNDDLKDFSEDFFLGENQKTSEVIEYFKSKCEKSKINDLQLLFMTKYTSKRSRHDKIRFFKEKCVWLLKTSKEIKFSKEPYKSLRNILKSYLKKENESYFDFTDNGMPLYLYEDFEPEFKFYHNDESEEAESFSVKDDTVNIIVIFNFIDLDSIQKIKDIYLYKKKYPDEIIKCTFIVNTSIKDEESLKKTKEMINELGLGKINFNYLNKGQPQFERKMLDSLKYTSILLYDFEGSLRFINKASKFSTNEIDFLLQTQYYPLEKNSFKKLRINTFETYKKIMNQEKVLKSNFYNKISLRKVKIYNTDQKLVRCYYELPRLLSKFKEKTSQINEECIQNLKDNLGMISSVQIKILNKDEIIEKIKTSFRIVLNQFKLDKVIYSLDVQETRRVYKYLRMNVDKTKNFNCFLYVSNEVQNEVVNLISDITNLIRKVKFQVPIEYHTLPQNNVKFKNTVKLLNTQKKTSSTSKNALKEPLNPLASDILDLNNSQKFKLIIVFSENLQCLNEWTQFIEKIEEIFNSFNEVLETFFVYIGENLKEGEKYLKGFFLKNESIRIYHSKGNSSDHLFINSNYFQYYAVLLSKDNLVQFKGIPSEFDFESIIKDLILNGTLEENKLLNKIEKEKFEKLKNSFETLTNYFKSLLNEEKIFYQPFLEFSSSKLIEFNPNSEHEISYKNLKIQIILKKKFNFGVELDDFVTLASEIIQKKNLEITYFDTVSVNPPKNCSECNTKTNEIYYYCSKSNLSFCKECEKIKNKFDPSEPFKTKLYPFNLLVIKNDPQRILCEEIIENYFNMNLNQESYKIEINPLIYQYNLLNCAICSTDLNLAKLIYISLTVLCNERLIESKRELGINDKNNPLIFCENCGNTLINGTVKSITRTLKNRDHNCISSDFDKNKFILRKIYLK